MIYTANNIADFFISQVNYDSGDTISHLKLQKLVYYSQVWHYTIFNEPVFDEKIEAWMHGPVIRSVYERFKNFNVYTPIDIKSIEIQKVDFPKKTFDLLFDINSIYGEHSASYLEELTHTESPWIEARNGVPIHEKCENEITLESIKSYYSKVLNDSKEQA